MVGILQLREAVREDAQILGALGDRAALPLAQLRGVRK